MSVDINSDGNLEWSFDDLGHEVDVKDLIAGSTIELLLLSGYAELLSTSTPLPLNEIYTLILESNETEFRVYGDGDTILSIVYAGEEEDVNMYAFPSIVPAAISSQLDDSGEERIHIAPYIEVEEYNPEPPVDCNTLINIRCGSFLEEDGITDVPEGFVWSETESFSLEDTNGNITEFVYSAIDLRYLKDTGDYIPEGEDMVYTLTFAGGEGSYCALVTGDYSSCG